MTDTSISGYSFGNEKHSHAHGYLLPTIKKIVDNDIACMNQNPLSPRVFDLGCGNGSVGQWFCDLGYDVTGVDPSSEGIQLAHQHHPNLKLETGDCYENLAERFGAFPLVVSLEVVEHIYAPREFAATLYSLVEPGGYAIVSTPYHSYWKNLMLSMTGKMESHFTALWDHGHIKFWSLVTLRQLLTEAGFSNMKYYRVGRFPMLAKSMVAVVQRS